MKFLTGLLAATAMVAMCATGASADLLTINPGTGTGVFGGGINPTGGSFFLLGSGLALINAGSDGGITEGIAQASTQANGPGVPMAAQPIGLMTSGVTAPAGVGQADGGPSGDNWLFSGNFGQIVSGGAGISRTDFSNIAVAWGEVANIPMGAGSATNPFTGATQTGLTFTDNGDGTYSADYGASVPAGDPSGFGGAPWFLHLEGNIVAVPEPMSMALVGSSLFGLLGLRRKFQA